MKQRGTHLLAVLILIAACEASKPAPADSQVTGTGDPGPLAIASDTDSARAFADVGVYFETKKKYGKAGALQDGWSRPTKELKDLDARLRAIIGPVIIDGRAVPTRITLAEAQYDGQDGGQELDGQTFSLAGVESIVSTRRLLSGWLASRGMDSANGSLAALESDIGLGPVFSGTAAAQQYANIRKHADLGDDVFIAKLVEFALDNGPWPPDKLIVGVARGERIYLD